MPAAAPTGTLLPSVTSLQLVGIPSLVVVLLFTVLAGLVVAAVRQFRSARRTR
jgi:riboflavin transporter FmnP